MVHDRSFDSLIKSTVDDAVEARLKDVGATLDSLSDSIDDKKRAVQLKLDDLTKMVGDVSRATQGDLDQVRTQSSALKKEIEQVTEDLRNRAIQKINWVVIPIVAIILLMGALGLWAVVGAVAFKLQEQVKTASHEITVLQAALKSKQDDLTRIEPELKKLLSEIDAIKGSAPFAAISKKIEAQDAMIKLLERKVQASERKAQPSGKP